MKINRTVLAEHVGVKPLSVSVWFSRNKRTMKSLEDIADFVLYHRIKNNK